MGRWHDKELNDLGTEGVRELLQYSDRRVLQSAFKTAHVGSIDTSVSREIFLRQGALDPKSPEIPRHKCLRPHAKRRALCSSLNHGQ